MNKKGISVFSVLLSILLVIGVFTGMFLFFQDNMERADLDVDSKYLDLQRNLTARQVEIDAKALEVRGAIANVTEAESGLVVAYYTLKGFGKSITLLVGVVTTGIGTVTNVLMPFDIIPQWVRTILLSVIVLVIIFALLKAIKGGSSNV